MERRTKNWHLFYGQYVMNVFFFRYENLWFQIWQNISRCSGLDRRLRKSSNFSLLFKTFTCPSKAGKSGHVVTYTFNNYDKHCYNLAISIFYTHAFQNTNYVKFILQTCTDLFEVSNIKVYYIIYISHVLSTLVYIYCAY